VAETITIKVYRCDPEIDGNGKLEEYTFEKTPAMRVLDAIKSINEQGANIAVRYYCEEFQCGSCTVLIDKVPRLACREEVQDGMVVEPIPDFPLIKDLLVDRSQHVAKHKELDRIPEKKTGARLDYQSFTRIWDAITCLKCGVCLASCPILHTRGGSYTYTGPEFMVSLFRAQFDSRIDKACLDAGVKDGMWECTVCNNCVKNCPQTIPVTDLILSLRQDTIEKKGSLVPASLRDLNQSLFKYHNPYAKAQSKRMHWAAELNLLDIGSSRKDLLYFIGCDQCYDTRNQDVARSIVRVLTKAGVDFGTLGVQEVNSGEPAFSTGEVALFEELARINIDSFRKYAVKTIITTSPHDFHVIKNEYPGLGGNFNVVHYTAVS